MNEVIEGLQTAIDGLKRAIGRDGTRQVRTTALKNQVKLLVKDYFDNQRPVLRDNGLSDADLSPVDEELQNIYRYAQRATTAKFYLDSLKGLSTAINDLELICLTRLSGKIDKTYFDSKDQQIIETLNSVCPSAAVSYEQGLTDLYSDRISWRGTATEFREALRETLDVLAPDEEVKKMPGFKLEPDTKGPTMKQKAKYVFKARNLAENAIDAPLDSIGLIEGLTSNLVRSAYVRSSIGTHTPITKPEALKVKNYVATVLAELLEI
jgi:hypothetical protein